MAEHTGIIVRESGGQFKKGFTANVGWQGGARVDKTLKASLKPFLHECQGILLDIIRNTHQDVKCSTRVQAIKLLFEYVEGKPVQAITVASAADNAEPTDLSRLEMRARAEALDPVILELQEEMKEAEEYQAFLDSKSKKKPKEKVINE